MRSDSYKIIPQMSIPTKFQTSTTFGVSCRGGGSSSNMWNPVDIVLAGHKD